MLWSLFVSRAVAAVIFAGCCALLFLLSARQIPAERGSGPAFGLLLFVFTLASLVGLYQTLTTRLSSEVRLEQGRLTARVWRQTLELTPDCILAVRPIHSSPFSHEETPLWGWRHWIRLELRRKGVFRPRTIYVWHSDREGLIHELQQAGFHVTDPSPWLRVPV